MPDDKPINRRRFFREGLGELFRPLIKAVDPVTRVADGLSKLENPTPAKPTPPTSKATFSRWIRPPGALAEQDFLDTCSRCGECVKVCPAQCIQIDPTTTQGGGAPFILPDDKPCVLCEGLKCMPACPTGALVPTILSEIDIGTARWNESICVRSKGENCTICIDKCPIGSAAIELNEGKVRVIDDGCTGCGVCQHECPTDPKSIFVIPRGSMRPA